MYTASNMGPGSTLTRCIKVTYTGSMPADVRLYTTSSGLGLLADVLDLTIEKGTIGAVAFPSCTGFTAEGTIYTGTLGAFAGVATSYANGFVAYPGSQTSWNPGDSVAYRFTLSLPLASTLTGAIAAHDFVWEAHNQ